MPLPFAQEAAPEIAQEAARPAGMRRKPVTFPPASRSGKLVIRLIPADVALFRFLLEGYDNLALFTVLDSRAALLKLLFSPHQESDVRAALSAMQEAMPLTVEDWPLNGRPA